MEDFIFLCFLIVMVLLSVSSGLVCLLSLVFAIGHWGYGIPFLSGLIGCGVSGIISYYSGKTFYNNVE